MTDNHFHWYRDGGFGRDWGDFTLDKLISCENFMENGKSIPLSHCHRSQQIVLDWSATAGKTTAEKATTYLLSFDLRMRLGLEGVAEASKIAQRTPLKNIPGFTKVNPLVRACASCFIAEPPSSAAHQAFLTTLDSLLNQEKVYVIALRNLIFGDNQRYPVNGVPRSCDRTSLNGSLVDSHDCVICPGKADEFLDEKMSLYLLNGFYREFVKSRLFLSK